MIMMNQEEAMATVTRVTDAECAPPLIEGCGHWHMSMPATTRDEHEPIDEPLDEREYDPKYVFLLVFIE